MAIKHPSQYDETSVTLANWQNLPGQGVSFEQFSVIVLADAIDTIARVWLRVWRRYMKWNLTTIPVRRDNKGMKAGTSISGMTGLSYKKGKCCSHFTVRQKCDLFLSLHVSLVFARRLSNITHWLSNMFHSPSRKKVFVCINLKER